MGSTYVFPLQKCDPTLEGLRGAVKIGLQGIVLGTPHRTVGLCVLKIFAPHGLQRQRQSICIQDVIHRRRTLSWRKEVHLASSSLYREPWHLIVSSCCSS